MDVVIIGAGLVGLASAFELARRGAQVRVFDAAEPAKAASWAGAGMLAPYTEEMASPEFAAFCADSLARYPAFVDDLRDRSGVDSQLRLDGILHAAYGDQERLELRGRAETLAAQGCRARWLERAEAVAEEPALGPQVLGALLVEDEGQVDNRRLGRALRAACESLGVRVTTGERVDALESDERRVRGVRTSQGFVTAPVVINAAGAWAGELTGVPPHARVRVIPIKGQMCALGMPRLLVQRVIWFPGGYAVPRSDGRLLLGATVERAGFDVRLTAHGLHALLDAALRALPALRDLALVETWAGLRPGSADGLPFIGATALDGYVVATGHFRNGILLAPATAQLVADVVEGHALPRYANFFSPQRDQEPLAVAAKGAS